MNQLSDDHQPRGSREQQQKGGGAARGELGERVREDGVNKARITAEYLQRRGERGNSHISV